MAFSSPWKELNEGGAIVANGAATVEQVEVEIAIKVSPLRSAIKPAAQRESQVSEGPAAEVGIESHDTVRGTEICIAIDSEVEPSVVVEICPTDPSAGETDNAGIGLEAEDTIVIGVDGGTRRILAPDENEIEVIIVIQIAPGSLAIIIVGEGL